jgi:hypothetical protein
MTWGYICDTHCPRISPTPDMHLKTASITLTKGHARVHEYTCIQMLHLSRRAYKLSRIHATKKKTCNIFNRRPCPPVFDLGSHCHESLFHVGSILSTRLQERNTDLISKSLVPRTKNKMDQKKCQNQQGSPTTKTWNSRTRPTPHRLEVYVLTGSHRVHTIRRCIEVRKKTIPALHSTTENCGWGVARIPLQLRSPPPS